jgi:Neuraminidase (sialidase)
MNPPDKWTGNGLLSCYLSDDAGKTWRRSKESFPLLDSVGNPAAAQEPGVVELKDGRVLMFIRTLKGAQYFAWSNDGGETWSDPVPSPLRSPLSPASIERIPQTGDLLAVWNDHHDPAHKGGGKRTPLSAAISKDDGKTWSKPITLCDDPDGWYCYIAIHFEGDHVLLGHCAGGPGQGGSGLSVTQITRFPIDALYEHDRQL